MFVFLYFFPCVLSGGWGAKFCDFEAVWATVFAVFVGQLLAVKADLAAERREYIYIYT